MISLVDLYIHMYVICFNLLQSFSHLQLVPTTWIMHILDQHSLHGIDGSMSFLSMKYKKCLSPQGDLTTTGSDSPTGTGVGKSREAMDYPAKNSSQSIDLERPEISATILWCLVILWEMVGMLFVCQILV